MKQRIESELEAFSQSSDHAKIMWLSALIYRVSMHARDTYEVGSDDVVAPKRLRLFNELLNRLSSFMLTTVARNEPAMPNDQFFRMIGHYIDDLGLEAEQVFADP